MPRFNVILLMALAGAGLLAGLVWPLSANPRSGQAAFRAEPGSRTLQWGADVPVNPTPTANPDVQRNVALALDPTLPNHVVASYDSFLLTPDYYTNSGFAYSTDGGRSWKGGRFFGPWQAGTDISPAGQTSVSFDQHSTVYYSSQGTGSNLSGY